MSLRRQLIALFAALAVVPLLLVGLLDYIRSIHALEDVIASNTAVIAEQAAAELQERYSGPATNLALLAENTAAAAILDGVDAERRTASPSPTCSDSGTSLANSSPGSSIATRPRIRSRASTTTRPAAGRVRISTSRRFPYATRAATRLDASMPRCAWIRSTRVLRSTCASEAAAVRRCSTQRRGTLIPAGAGTTPLPSLLDFQACRRLHERDASPLIQKGRHVVHRFDGGRAANALRRSCRSAT